jgi:hypothetical protein
VASTRYAERTEVSAEKSRGEIERILSRYGAAAFGYGWNDQGQAVVTFVAHGRRIQFTVSLPRRTDYRHTPARRYVRSDSEIEKAWEQATRQRWRALTLMVKAKLEAVAAGIATFEEEFLPYTLVPGPDGTPITVATLMEGQVVAAYEKGVMPRGIMLALESGDDA